MSSLRLPFSVLWPEGWTFNCPPYRMLPWLYSWWGHVGGGQRTITVVGHTPCNRSTSSWWGSFPAHTVKSPPCHRWPCFPSLAAGLPGLCFVCAVAHFWFTVALRGYQRGKKKVNSPLARWYFEAWSPSPVHLLLFTSQSPQIATPRILSRA